MLSGARNTHAAYRSLGPKKSFINKMMKYASCELIVDTQLWKLCNTSFVYTPFFTEFLYENPFARILSYQVPVCISLSRV